MADVTWSQVLAWRMRRQYVDPFGDGVPAVGIARRLGGVQAQVASAAALAVAVRQAKPAAGEVTAALDERAVVKAWAMRGTLHLLSSDDAGAYLALSGAHRKWETGSWQRAFKATPADLEAVAEAAAEALAGGTALSREELTAQVVDRTGSEHLREVLSSGWGTVLKLLAWWGVLCHGPVDGNRVSFVSPADWVPGWRGVPATDDAAPVVIGAFLGAHGPGTPATFDAWLSRGMTRRGMLKGWFAAMADELATVDVDGVPMQLLATDVDELLGTEPSDAVHLLGGFDQYVLGAGTNATYMLDPEHRAEVSRAAGWISPVVLHGGRVAGVWQPDDGGVAVSLWDDVPPSALEPAVERMREVLAALT